MVVQWTHHWHWSLNVMGTEASWKGFEQWGTSNKILFGKFNWVAVSTLNWRTVRPKARRSTVLKPEPG